MRTGRTRGSWRRCGIMKSRFLVGLVAAVIYIYATLAFYSNVSTRLPGRPGRVPTRLQSRLLLFPEIQAPAALGLIPLASFPRRR